MAELAQLRLGLEVEVNRQDVGVGDVSHKDEKPEEEGELKVGQHAGARLRQAVLVLAEHLNSVEGDEHDVVEESGDEVADEGPCLALLLLLFQLLHLLLHIPSRARSPVCKLVEDSLGLDAFPESPGGSGFGL